MTRVLLVDDDADGRTLARRLLTLGGFLVDTAENGAIAVERVRRVRYDAILMDLQMPVMDGFEAAQRIRAWEQNGRRTRTPILAFSTDPPDRHRHRCTACGMVSYIQKPVEGDSLLRRIRYWVGKARFTAEPAIGDGGVNGA